MNNKEREEMIAELEKIMAILEAGETITNAIVRDAYGQELVVGDKVSVGFAGSELCGDIGYVRELLPDSGSVIVDFLKADNIRMYAPGLERLNPSQE